MTRYTFGWNTMRSIITDFGIGLTAFGKALTFMREHRLRHYFFYPLALSILYWYGGFQLAESITEQASTYLHGRLDIEPSVVDDEGRLSFFWEAIETIKRWYNDGYTAILSFLLRIAMWILLVLIGKYLLLALLSPILALLSERCEEILTGKEYPFQFKQFMKDIARGLLVAGRNFLAEMSMLIFLFILGLLVAPLAPVGAALGFLISSFYYGFSLLDYVNERHRLSMRDSFRSIRKRKGLSIALGIGIATGMALPLIGFIIASFISTLGVVAALLAISEGGRPYNSGIKLVSS